MIIAKLDIVTLLVIGHIIASCTFIQINCKINVILSLIYTHIYSAILAYTPNSLFSVTSTPGLKSAQARLSHGMLVFYYFPFNTCGW